MRSAYLAVLVVFALIVLVTRSLWFSASSNRWDTADLVSCRERYRAARTQADTATIDAFVPRSSNGLGGAESCGSLREADADFFGARNPEGTESRR